MFSTKQGVDKHVANVLGRIRDEKERNNRGYQIAKLYYDVKEFELAKRYVAGFLSVKESFAPAHKLLGQILNGLNQTEKALTAYKRSLELDDKQKDVLLKICELYLRTNIDAERAKYWAERAEKVWPHHDTVFKLREKIYAKRDGDQNNSDLEKLISSELTKRPKDPQLRAKLLRLFIENGRVNEAYVHAMEVEKRAPYQSSVEWYQCLQEVFQLYQEESGEKINGVFHQNLLLAQCHLTTLSLEKCKVADAADALHRFDQTIQKASKITGGSEWTVIYTEMQAQLYYLAATLLLKRAQQDHLGWMDASQMAAACYTASYAFEPANKRAAWYAKASEDDKKVFDRMVQMANMRASQTGHMMRQMAKGDSQKWISSLKESQFGEKGRGRLYDTLFTLRHFKGSKSKSALYQGTCISNLKCVYPTDAQLKEYDKVAHLLHGGSLHHLVWIALQYYSVRDRTQPDYAFSMFEDLQYSTANLELASPESLSQLDTRIFMYATVRTTALHQQEQQRLVPPSGEKPSLLPVLISDRLCTDEQGQWWNTAYQLFKNTAKQNLGRLRLVLQRGLEAMRLRRNHGMDISLVVHIARTFEERVEELKAKCHSTYDFSNEIEHLQNRAVQFWREACDLLERLQRNQTLPSPKQKLFANYEVHLADKQIKELLEEGNFFLACDAMNHGEDETAVEAFEKLISAEASYHQAQILRKMADEALGNMTRGQEDEVEEQEEALLTRAREALYLTMDRTRDNRHHKLAPHLAADLDEIESRLNRLSSDKTVNDSQRSEAQADTSVVGEMNVSSKALTPSAQSTPHPKARPKLNVSLRESPQTRAQPSPERLDAQIRSLSFSQETLIKQLMDRNEELVKQNAAILAELSASRKLIEKLMMARPAEPPAPYPVVMSAAAASPLHHPGLAAAHAVQSPLGPHAASTPPRPLPHVPGAGSPFYGSPYRPHPVEFDYSAGYPPHAGIPIYPHGAAPPPLHHYPGFPHDPHHVGGAIPPQAIPAAALAGSVGKEPSAAGPVKSSGAAPQVEDEDEIYYYDDDEEGGDNDDADGDMFQMAESQLVQDWPYGNSVSVSGKSTINYSPQRTQQLPAQGYYGQGPATTGLPMPGPGFFSSPERPTGAYNAARYIPQSGVATQLHAPRPGFVGTIGSPVSAAQTPPSSTTANKTGGVLPAGRSPAQTGTGTNEAALTGGSLIKMPPAPQASNVASPSALTAAMATGAPITTVTGIGSLGKEIAPKLPAANEEDDDEAADDSYQGPDFEPIIPLPDEVEVKTGEEDEKVLLEARCKLYRFVENQWKERGLGDIKILWREESGQARVVMRREQVLKVCANHKIKPDMNIEYKSEKEAKVLTWVGMDFSETEGEVTKFSCKFKTEEIAKNFKAKFEEAKVLVAKSEKPTSGQKKERQAEKSTSEGVDLLSKLKPKAGSWDCDACYVNNPSEVFACLACAQQKPGAEIKNPQQKAIFGGGDSSTGGFTFGAAASSPASSTGFTFGSPATKPTTGTPQENKPATTGFTFGKNAAGAEEAKPTASGFTFGQSPAAPQQAKPASTGFTFGQSPAAPSQEITKPTSSGFTFTQSPAASQHAKPASTGLIFGQNPAVSQEAKPTVSSGSTFSTPAASSSTQGSSGFAFGSSPAPASSGFTFGSAPKPTSTETKTTSVISPPKFSFSKPVFGETATPAADALKSMASKADATKLSDKPTFGGFTFTSKPVVAEKKEEPVKEDKPENKQPEKEAPKANPFASFSFGATTPQPSKPAETKTSEAPVVTFGSSTKSTPDFASLANSANSANLATKTSDFASPTTKVKEPFIDISTFKGFEGAGTKLFGSGKDEAADENGNADDYEPDVDFKPIIPLPDLVDVKTGEEDEIKLFCERAKLYRHDNESKQWKERGVGELKILKHKESGRCRVLMRREQVLKLCANFNITPEIKLNPLHTSDKAWCWYTNDYSEDEVKYEQLATKFKTGEVAKKFKDVFEQCQKDTPKETKDKTITADKKVEQSKDTSKPSLAQLFKKKEGQWECQGCYVQNKGDVIICPACQTPKPGCEAEAAKQKAAAPKNDPFAASYKLGGGAATDMGSAVSFTFGNAAATKKDDATQAPSTGQTFTFGSTTATSKKDDTPSKGTFLFGMPTSPRQASFSFNTASTPASATTAESSDTPAGALNLSTSGFKFGSTPSADSTTTPTKVSEPSKTFGLSAGGFTFTPTQTPAKDRSVKSPQSPEGDYYVNTEDEDSNIYFEPIVQLPEQVDLVTGEEDEEPLYCHRAKVFRFDDNQWKERGLGDVKILRHKETKKCRIVMRREQILKICLNHVINDSLELQSMQNTQGKAWVWVATDYAEGEPSDEKLAIRFKTAEIANDFQKAFDDAKTGKGKVIDLPPTPIKVRERTDSSSRDSTRERKDSARERKDSARERERRHSAGRSESPDKTKTASSLDTFSFKPQTTTGSSTSTPKVSFTFGSPDSKTTTPSGQGANIFGGSAQASSQSGKFSFGSSASFNFGTPTTAGDKPSAGGEAASSGAGSSLLAQMLMSDEPISDVEVTFEKKPSKDQEAKAAEYKLPSTFYNYEDAAPCPGCRGCEADEGCHKDILYVKEELPTEDKVALAQKYMLPKSFYLYENKPPCPGCLGCYDDIEGTTVTTGKLATKVNTAKAEKSEETKPKEAAKGANAPTPNAPTPNAPTPNAPAANSSLFGGKTSSEFSFAAIAAKSPPGAFAFGNKPGGSFSFAGSGAQLFQNAKPGGGGDDGDDNEVVQGDDVHFEPIVQLDEVEVKTGEEDETAIYSQRSKLFRFTDGQWKERGIGEMKILKNSKTGRFRLLMRREQILKTCCNQAITTDLELRPMNTSEVAWCWIATDFSEGKPEDEQFALKFKNQQLARIFKEKVTECQQLLETLDSSTTEDNKATDTTEDSSALDTEDADQSTVLSEADQSGFSQSGAEGGGDDEEYETDEEEEMELLFTKRATMFYENSDQTWKQIGMGDIQVVYDDDVNGNRIRMSKDNDALICNHIICKNYHLQCNEKKKFVEWSAKDFSTDEPIKRTFKVQFSSKNSVAEFKTVFNQGLDLANECDIREVTDFVPTPIFSEK